MKYENLIEELRQLSVPLPKGQPSQATRSYMAIAKDAADTIELLGNPALGDFGQYQVAKERTGRARADSATASVILDKALMDERCAELMSQHEPLASLGIDREKMRQVLHYVQTGRLK